LQACLHKPEEENKMNPDAKHTGFVLLQGFPLQVRESRWNSEMSNLVVTAK